VTTKQHISPTPVSSTNKADRYDITVVESGAKYHNPKP